LSLLRRSEAQTHFLTAKRVLITLGGTREPIDPVRYIGNSSSGLMGLALARAAVSAGASVTVVAANVAKPQDLANIDWVEANTAAEMHATVTKFAPDADVVLMAAAVADFSPVSVAGSKIKKEATARQLEIRLVENPDILKQISSAKGPNQTIIGFAAETTFGDVGQLLSLAEHKLNRKGCDYLIANDVSSDARFGSETTSLHLVDKNATATNFTGSKQAVASELLRHLFAVKS
jgi:phosphopantothenoylcysteine decarboxylase/phosphopantothenate--cysteine ligase